MLAYVFSHVPGADADANAYEDALRGFHRALASARLAGFVSSLTYRTPAGYSDWYFLESSSALDTLNEAATSGGRARPHDAAASMAVDGVGKLLSLADGVQGSESAFEIRFAKPKGMSYADLYAKLRPLVAEPGAGLWRRMMVLGPAPEFCLVAPRAVDLPPEMRPEVVTRRPI